MLKGGGGVAQGRANNGGARMEMFRCDTRVTYGRGQARHAIGAGRGQARQDACCGTQTCNGAPAFMHARQGLGRVVRWQWARESREKAARKARRRRRAGWRVRGRGGGDGGGRCGGTEACSGMRGRRRVVTDPRGARGAPEHKGGPLDVAALHNLPRAAPQSQAVWARRARRRAG